jgi:hypothetical protein
MQKWQNSITKMIDNSAPSLDQLFWQCLCLAKHFLSFINLRMFWWQYGWWHHQTQLVSCLPRSGLDSWKFCNYSNEWPKTPPWYSHFLSGLYHLETVVVWNLTESRRQVWSLTYVFIFVLKIVFKIILFEKPRFF